MICVTSSLLFLMATCLLLFSITTSAAPLSTQVEILRINGVDEREIEHTLNPNHILPSAYTPPSTSSPTKSLTQTLLDHNLKFHADNPHSDSPPPTEEEALIFAATIDPYSTARAPITNSESAFEMVRNWMTWRSSDGDVGEDDGVVVTGRMGSMRVTTDERRRRR